MGLVLVILQVLLNAVIILTANWWPTAPVPLAVSIPGALIAIAAWRAMDPKRIRMQPSPNSATELVTRGPYRWIRHPMYSGQLLFSAALLASNFAWWRVALWFVLLVVLIAKLMLEERMLIAQFPEYTAYSNETKRLLPAIWYRGQRRHDDDIRHGDD